MFRGHFGLRAIVGVYTMAEPKPKVPRPRFTDGDVSLADVLQPFVTTASFLESGTPSGQSVSNHVGMLSALKRVQSNLSFTPLTVKTALLALWEVKTWHAPPGVDPAEWATTMSSRLRGLCRFLQQGPTKSPKAKWLQDFNTAFAAQAGQSDQGKSGGAQSDGAQAKSEARVAGASSIPPAGKPLEKLGFDQQSGQAYRKNSDGSREYGEMRWSSDDPMDSPMCVFKNGDVVYCGERLNKDVPVPRDFCANHKSRQRADAILPAQAAETVPVPAVAAEVLVPIPAVAAEVASTALVPADAAPDAAVERHPVLQKVGRGKRDWSS